MRSFSHRVLYQRTDEFATMRRIRLRSHRMHMKYYGCSWDRKEDLPAGMLHEFHLLSYRPGLDHSSWAAYLATGRWRRIPRSSDFDKDHPDPVIKLNGLGCGNLAEKQKSLATCYRKEALGRMSRCREVSLQITTSQTDFKTCTSTVNVLVDTFSNQRSAEAGRVWPSQKKKRSYRYR